MVYAATSYNRTVCTSPPFGGLGSAGTLDEMFPGLEYILNKKSKKT
jgi:hypothetical protein